MADKQIQIPVNDLKDKVYGTRKGQIVPIKVPDSGYGKVSIEFDGGRIHKWTVEESFKPKTK